jgi:hypothetical protein
VPDASLRLSTIRLSSSSEVAFTLSRGFGNSDIVGKSACSSAARRLNHDFALPRA